MRLYLTVLDEGSTVCVCSVLYLRHPPVRPPYREDCIRKFAFLSQSLESRTKGEKSMKFEHIVSLIQMQ